MSRKVKIPLIILASILVVLIVLYTLMFFNGMSGLYLDGKPADGQVRIACIGDSITYGHGVSNWAKNNYPEVLNGLLGEEYHVANFGCSGECVQNHGDQPYMKSGKYEESLAYQADVLVMMLGTNDCKPTNWKTIDTFEADYRALLESYLNGEKAPEVYLCTPAKVYATGDDGATYSYDLNPEWISEITQLVRDLAEEYGFTLIDVYGLTEAHPEWFELDGVHPNAQGAAAIAELVASVIK